MASLQQQKVSIDEGAQRAKDEIDRAATKDRQVAADEESAKIRQDAEDAVAKVQYDAQR